MQMIRLLLLAAALASAPFAPAPVFAAETPAAKATVKNISIDQAEKQIAQTKDVVVLDIRAPKEIANGRVEGSKAVNFYDADFKAQIARLDKSKTYVVFCAVGGRSAKACAQMVEMGFQDVRNVEGGMKAWEKAGKKTVK
jgi:rhodanese-related sulfurtransferase